MLGIFTKKDKRTDLEKEIHSVLCNMSTYSPTDNEYIEMVEILERLYKLKEKEPKTKVSPDTIAIIAGNLLGIALILGYEKTNVLTSKALGFVVRGRV